MAEPTSTQPAPAVEQAPQADVVARMGNYLKQFDEDQAKANQPEAPPPPEKPTAPQPVEVAESPESPASDDELTPEDLPVEAAPPQLDADAFEIVHNGAQVKMTRAQAIEYAQKGFDYDRKTQALAEQSRSVQQALQRATEMEQIQGALTADLAQVEAFKAQLAPYQGVDWVRLASEQPLEYPKYRAAYDVAMQNMQGAVQRLQQKAGQVQQARQMLTAQIVQQEQPKLMQLVPELADPAKRDATIKSISNYLHGLGVDDATIAAIDNCQPIPMGAVAISIINDAAKYRALVNAKTSKSKLVQSAPPVAKPGAAQTQTAQAEKQQRTMQRLRKTGTLEAAAAALAARQK